MVDYAIKTKFNYFAFDKLEENTIDIRDISNSLSRNNRFTGHTNRPYTVAQHSLYVAYMMSLDGLDARMQLLGLMHDFHEAYFSDMSSPLKWFLKAHYGFDANEYCDLIDVTIFDKLKVPFPTFEEHKIIKEYDWRAYLHERYALFDDTNHTIYQREMNGKKSDFVEHLADFLGKDQDYYSRSLIQVYEDLRSKLYRVSSIKDSMAEVLNYKPDDTTEVSYIRNVVETILKSEEEAIYKKVNGEFVRIN